MNYHTLHCRTELYATDINMRVLSTCECTCTAETIRNAVIVTMGLPGVYSYCCTACGGTASVPCGQMTSLF